MPITNLMKDIVVNTLDEVLKQEKDERITDLGREEIIAYVLNRVQPKYVTSERGLLYGILDARHMVQQRVDILFLIHEAVHLISTRRDHHVKKKGEETEDSSFFFPHIVGRVLEESSLTVVPDLEVSLFYKESLAPMIDSDWDNPYRTNESTNGYYHFWPRHSGSRMGNNMAVSFTLSFRHPQCEDVQREVSLEALLRVGQVKTEFIPLVLVSASIGAGSSGE